MTEHHDQLYSAVLGCLAGGAIGDAMGGVTEMMHFETIEAKFGWVDEVREYGSDSTSARFDPGERAGRYTDDTRLKHLICDVIAEAEGRVGVDRFGKSWERLMTGWFFTPVVNAYHKIQAGTRPREAGRGNMASNSSAMCIAPIGMMNACDPRQAAADAYEVASSIHEGYALDGAALIAALVAGAFDDEVPIHESIETAITLMDFDSDMRPLVEQAVQLAADTDSYTHFREEFYRTMTLPWPQENLSGEEQPLPGFYDTADPREAIPAAIGLIHMSNGDPAKAIPYAANFGRDADTIGSMVGSVTGAYKRIGGIPPNWVKKVNAANSKSQDEFASQVYRALRLELDRQEARLKKLRGMAQRSTADRS